jgi:hypothetical protein
MRGIVYKLFKPYDKYVLQHLTVLNFAILCFSYKSQPKPIIPLNGVDTSVSVGGNILLYVMKAWILIHCLYIVNSVYDNINGIENVTKFLVLIVPCADLSVCYSSEKITRMSTKKSYIRFQARLQNFET